MEYPTNILIFNVVLLMVLVWYFMFVLLNTLDRWLYKINRLPFKFLDIDVETEDEECYILTK